jgi:hypothetical protein
VNNFSSGAKKNTNTSSKTKNPKINNNWKCTRNLRSSTNEACLKKYKQKTDLMEFKFNGFEISTATRPSIDPIAYPARKKSYFKRLRGRGEEKEKKGI